MGGETNGGRLPDTAGKRTNTNDIRHLKYGIQSETRLSETAT